MMTKERKEELLEFWKHLWLSNWTEDAHLRMLDAVIPHPIHPSQEEKEQ